MYLLLRTDRPEAQIGLYIQGQPVLLETWTAHYQLAETLHQKIKQFLETHNTNLKELTGIVVYKGPGSFTGLRIGICCANAFAYALSVPIVATQDEKWIADGINALQNNKNEIIALPEYGAEPRTTVQKK
jgi:tRNA threonylcarbamoyladenosine biosynthesis protein TsaB